MQNQAFCIYPLHPSYSCLKFLVFQSPGDSRFFGQDGEDDQDKCECKFPVGAFPIRSCKFCPNDFPNFDFVI